jgi:hypothetical protein
MLLTVMWDFHISMQLHLALQVGLQRHRLLVSAFVGYALTITEQITETESECWQVLNHMVVHQESDTPYSLTSLVTSTIRSTNALNDAHRNRASTVSKCLNQSEFGIKTSRSNAKIAVTNVRTEILT